MLAYCNSMWPMSRGALSTTIACYSTLVLEDDARLLALFGAGPVLVVVAYL